MRISDWSSDVCSSDLNILRVTGEDEPSGTISGARSITGGAGIVADSRREAFDNGGHYGLQEGAGTSGAVSGHPTHNNGRWNLADPRDVPMDGGFAALSGPQDTHAIGRASCRGMGCQYV